MKSENSVFTVRLPVDLQKKLDNLAESMDRSRSWLVSDALQSYVEYQQWYIEKVQEGIAAAERGEFATEEEMEALFNRYKNT